MSRVGLGAAAYTLRFFPGFHCARTRGSGRAGRRTRPAGKTQLRIGVGGQQPESAHERSERPWKLQRRSPELGLAVQLGVLRQRRAAVLAQLQGEPLGPGKLQRQVWLKRSQDRLLRLPVCSRPM